MPRTYVSYRRSDTAGWAGRVYDELARRFGPENVFLDVDTLQPGADFIEVSAKAVRSSDAVIALIGPRWLDEPDSGEGRTIDDPGDFVRREIAAALTAGLPILPVLVDGA